MRRTLPRLAAAAGLLCTIETASASTPLCVERFRLESNGDGDIVFESPDGHSYTLPLGGNNASGWIFATSTDEEGREIKQIGLFRDKNANVDGRLVLNVSALQDPALTLLHTEDDLPSRFFLAVDQGNQHLDMGGVQVVEIVAQGVKGSPLGKNIALKIMNVGVCRQNR